MVTSVCVCVCICVSMKEGKDKDLIFPFLGGYFNLLLFYLYFIFNYFNN